ncbi:ParB/RepB/Spo0J family partition protein [Deinococcus sp. 23YEL01]|uniref:ParB/RepB/Spo0J family partition protein n=1 Tax=Deinococcus sp. 23YEL01 TaxID=2745871 RepID=UPI001E3DFD49|nr:ParB/RepB/Spo0J family partition protein [Deinococcus sp. 23YEL01]
MSRRGGRGSRVGGLSIAVQQARAQASNEELNHVVQEAYKAGMQDVELNQIDITGDWNPRGSLGNDPYGEADLAGLMAAIQEYGQLQPVLLRPHPDRDGPHRYQLVAGWRRYHSRRLLGDAVVLASVYPFKDDQLDALSTLENTQREELDQFEVVRGVFRTLAAQLDVEMEALPGLMSRVLKTGEDPHDLQDKLKVLTSASLSTFNTKYARVLRLRPEEIRAVYGRTVPPTVALELVRLGERPERTSFLQQAAADAWTTRTAKDRVNEALRGAQQRPAVHEVAARVTRHLKPTRLDALSAAQQSHVHDLLRQLEAALAPA